MLLFRCCWRGTISTSPRLFLDLCTCAAGGECPRDLPGPRGGAAGYEEKRYDGEVTRNAASYVAMMH